MSNTNTTPPGNDGLREKGASPAEGSTPAGGGTQPTYLELARDAHNQADQYWQQQGRTSWQRTMLAYRNKHFAESKYTSKEYAARSKLFRPKTRTAVRKDMAAVAASLFSTLDALAISPGNEADPKQQGAAAVLQEIVNYRTDRTSGRASLPWFKIAMGARMDSIITGVCASKQFWRLELKETGEEEEPIIDPMTGMPQIDPMTGAPMTQTMTVMEKVYDRPDSTVIPPELFLIDPTADWLDPAQSASYIIIKWPMRLDEIERRQQDPRDPWKAVDLSTLRQGTNQADTSSSTRHSRDGGQDRYDTTRAGNNKWDVCWVWEVFMKVNGEDLTWYSVDDRIMLTDPKPVAEVYPAFQGERPIVFGFSSLESHRLAPMAPAESWQQLQWEINDVANLTLDTIKQVVSPIAKVKRGRQVELDKVKARAANTMLLVQDMEDVEWDRPPEPGAATYQQMERLNNDFDSLSGTFDQGSVSGNRQLNETVGGMKLLAGAANAVQEYDQRVFIETWAEPVIGQITKLIQYYESDETVLGLAGERAQLHQKFGIDQITDDLLEQQVTVRIDVGLGVGDPAQRIAKFANAATVLAPIIQNDPRFASGEIQLNIEEMAKEVFGASGYRDGGKRFIVFNPPAPPPPPPPDILAKAELDKAKAVDAQASAGLKGAQTEKTRAETQMGKLDMVRGFLGDQRDERQQGVDNQMKVADFAGKRQDAADGKEAGLRKDAITARSAEMKSQDNLAKAKSQGKDAPKPKPQGDKQQNLADLPPEMRLMLMQALMAALQQGGQPPAPMNG